MTHDLLKAALLGTDKYVPGPAEPLRALYDQVTAGSSDKEDRFLKLAAATLLYEEAGQKPAPTPRPFTPGAAETAPFISEALAAAFRTAWATADDILLDYLFFRTAARGEVIRPEWVPMLLDKALASRQHALAALGGQTAQWLCGLNPEWSPLLSGTENRWETGTHTERKAFLTEYRKQDPAGAATLLRAALPEESAANRQAFIETLATGLSDADIPLLTDVLQDKSQKVRDAAMHLLRGLEGSAVNESYLSFLEKIWSVREERQLVFLKKKTLFLDETIPADEALFQTGISKVSSQKGVSDAVHVAGELLGWVHPTALAGRLGLTDQQVIEQLLQHPQAGIWIPAAGKAAVRYSHAGWAGALLHAADHPETAWLAAVPPDDRAGFFARFLPQQTGDLVRWLMDDAYTPIPLSSASRLLKALANDPYLLSSPGYRKLAFYLPGTCIPELRESQQNGADTSKDRYFRAQAQDMIRYIELKNTIS